jgi:hypothetical protein
MSRLPAACDSWTIDAVASLWTNHFDIWAVIRVYVWSSGACVWAGKHIWADWQRLWCVPARSIACTHASVHVRVLAVQYCHGTDIWLGCQQSARMPHTPGASLLHLIRAMHGASMYLAKRSMHTSISVYMCQSALTVDKRQSCKISGGMKNIASVCRNSSTSNRRVVRHDAAATAANRRVWCSAAAQRLWVRDAKHRLWRRAGRRRRIWGWCAAAKHSVRHTRCSC